MTLPNATTTNAETVEEFGQAWGYESITGMPGEFARRAYHWVEMCGVDPGPLLEAFRSVPEGVAPGSPEWTEHFAALADKDPTDLDALLLQEIAMFALPFTDMQPHQQAAYDLHAERYAEAGAAFDPPLQVVKIPVDGETVTGYLRVPESDGPQRAVFITGGADGWKAHRSLHATQEAFLAAGFVTLTIDLPGTGQSPFALEPGCHTTLYPVIKWLAEREEVDSGRVGAHQRSFGGYFAAAIASDLKRSDLAAIVSVAPPIHHAFHRPPPFLASRAEWFATLSLKTQGVLKANSEQPDLLVIQSLPDPLCPIEDTYLLAEEGLVLDTLVYAQDHHTAMLNGRGHLEFSIDWLKTRIDGRPLG